MDSTHEAWSELGIQSAAAQVCIFEHIERETITTMASGSPIQKYSKERMHEVSILVGLWQQIVSKIVPLMLLPDKFTDGLLSKVHNDGRLQRSILALAAGDCGDPPDDAQDLKAIAPFIVKHVPLLRILEADHRRENRVVAEEHEAREAGPSTNATDSRLKQSDKPPSSANGEAGWPLAATPIHPMALTHG